MQTEDGKPDVFVAVDRTAKFAYAALPPRARRMFAKDFLDKPTTAVPDKIHAVLTDNGIRFAKREGAEAYWSIPFDRLCDALGGEQRLTKVDPPRTDGQAERPNRTIKDAAVWRYDCQSHAPLKRHLQSFRMADNLTKRLKTLKGLTPYEYICKIWATEPKRFPIHPPHHTAGQTT